ncbi:uncharacterized protein LOC124492493 [Dermatophagoides farinae]|uniref:Uncharacterized protein n=1 Tax=Dermatophagoides farinae TaxID=6954 RepID=A0A9D4SHR8_DERFA|nr:uncharacterized protein LOC124492493 [Dermatophagoides farinae]KAH7642367.1 hypothetical protein HUG17_5412 [Dermatophagoides farinae]
MDQNEPQPKDNPWSDTKSIDTSDAQIKRETKQCVQGLPTVLANDIILQNLLKPTDGPKNQDELGPNIMPLQLNFGGQETKDVDGKKLAIKDAPNGKKVQYDPEKGFVMSSWSNFELEPQSEQLVTDPKGIFIKHITSTVINPNDLGKGSTGAAIDMKSLTATSHCLASNAWSNVLLYKPKEMIFKYDIEQKKLVAEDDANTSSSK